MSDELAEAVEKLIDSRALDFLVWCDANTDGRANVEVLVKCFEDCAIYRRTLLNFITKLSDDRYVALNYFSWERADFRHGVHWGEMFHGFVNARFSLEPEERDNILTTFRTIISENTVPVLQEQGTLDVHNVGEDSGQIPLFSGEMPEIRYSAYGSGTEEHHITQRIRQYFIDVINTPDINYDDWPF